MDTSPHKSDPRLGWGLAALLVAGNMIGSGLYLLPATLASIGSSSVVGWVVCGLGAVILALMFGALGRFRPEADGMTDYAQIGLGRFFGYQAALAYWAACLAGNVAVAVAGVGYLAFFFPVLKEPVPALIGNLGFIALATAAYANGARRAAGLGALALIVGLIPIAIAAAAGVTAFDPAVFSASWSPDGRPLGDSVPASLVIVFWALLGVESAAALSRSLKDPARDLGRASLAGVGMAFVVYVAACVAVFGVIPADVLAVSTSPYADLARNVFGASLGALVAGCAVVKVAGTVTGWAMMGGETARRAAEKGWLPRVFGGNGGRPISNPILNGLTMAALAAMTMQPSLGEQFGTLVGVTSVLTLSLYGLCAIGLIRAAPHRGWKALGALALLFAASAVVAAAADYLMPTAVFFAAVTALWFLWARRRAEAGPVVDPASAAP